MNRRQALLAASAALGSVGTALLAEPDTGFRSLHLKSTLLDALRHAKYSNPTPIQAELIPHALEGRDCIVGMRIGPGIDRDDIGLQRLKRFAIVGKARHV